MYNSKNIEMNVLEIPTQEDPITYEKLTQYNIVVFKHYDKLFHFSINTLIAMIHKNGGKFLNPLNNMPLPDDLVQLLKLGIARESVAVKINGETRLWHCSQKLGDIILDFYRKPGMKGKVGSFLTNVDGENWKASIGRIFSRMYGPTIIKDQEACIDRKHYIQDGLIKFIAMKDDLGYYLFNTYSPREFEIKIADSGNIHTDMGVRIHRMYRYMKDNGHEQFVGIIPEKYHVRPDYSKLQYSSNDERLLMSSIGMFTEDMTFETKSLIVQRLMQGAKIRAEVCDIFYSRTKIVHPVHSVIDKWNLKHKHLLKYKTSYYDL